jgi:hypothetical protein
MADYAKRESDVGSIYAIRPGTLAPGADGPVAPTPDFHDTWNTASHEDQFFDNWGLGLNFE